MNILFIAVGFLPETMSENLCNGKLVLSFLNEGWNVDVISRCAEPSSRSYSVSWDEPWTDLQKVTHSISYPVGNKFERLFDFVKSSVLMSFFPINGIRWAYRAYKKGLDLSKKKKYDVIITRSPSDISHIVGYKLSKKLNIPWIANWNDPATNIWPFPINYGKFKFYTHERYNKLMLTSSTYNSFPAETLKNHFINKYPFIDKQKCIIFPHIALLDSIYKKYKFQKIDKDYMYLCHSGNINIDRDADYLLKAISELKEKGCIIKLDIMGISDEYTLNLIRKYSLQDQIHYIGTLPYIDALTNLQKYDILVLIEQKMNFGIYFPSKLVDYAQSRKPIFAISPKYGFVSQTIGEYGGGTVADNTNYECIKKSLTDFYNDWKSDNLDKYSTDKLYNNSSTENVVNKYKDLINKIWK